MHYWKEGGARGEVAIYLCLNEFHILFLMCPMVLRMRELRCGCYFLVLHSRLLFLRFLQLRAVFLRLTVVICFFGGWRRW